MKRYVKSLMDLQTFQGALVHYSFVSKDHLSMAYMPFVKGGGLFLKIDESYQLGDLLRLHISFFDDVVIYHVLAQVIWITPKAAQNNRENGIGICFVSEANDDRQPLCKKIATILNLNNSIKSYEFYPIYG